MTQIIISVILKHQPNEDQYLQKFSLAKAPSNKQECQEASKSARTTGSLQHEPPVSAWPTALKAQACLRLQFQKALDFSLLSGQGYYCKTAFYRPENFYNTGISQFLKIRPRCFWKLQLTVKCCQRTRALHCAPGKEVEWPLLMSKLHTGNWNFLQETCHKEAWVSLPYS